MEDTPNVRVADERVHERRGDEKAVSRIGESRFHRLTAQGDFMVDGRLVHRKLRQCPSDPSIRRRLELEPAVPGKDEGFPHADGREPQFVTRVVEQTDDALRQAVGSERAPEPDVSVEQQSHERRTSHSRSVEAGETMSPTIRPVVLRVPSQLPRCIGGEGGTI
jgi:hypothetical protein